MSSLRDVQIERLEPSDRRTHVNYAQFCNQDRRMKDVVSRCPIEEVMRLLSGRWPTLLLYYLKDGTKRFSELRRDNPTLSHRMLAPANCASWRGGRDSAHGAARLSAARRVRSHAGGLAAGAADRRPGRLVGGAATRGAVRSSRQRESGVVGFIKRGGKDMDEGVDFGYDMGGLGGGGIWVRCWLVIYFVGGFYYFVRGPGLSPGMEAAHLGEQLHDAELLL